MNNTALTVRLDEEAGAHNELTTQLRGQLVSCEAEKQALGEELEKQIK